MYYVIERVSLDGDYNESSKVLSDHFKEDFAEIESVKLR